MLNQRLRIARVLEQAAHLGDNCLAQVARKLEMMQFALDPLRELHVRLLEFRLQKRLGPVFEFLFEILDPATQRLELRDRGEELSELLFVGLSPTLVIVIRRPFILLEDVAQVGLPRLHPSAHLDHHIERHRIT